jgi:hypothetical protein
MVRVSTALLGLVLMTVSLDGQSPRPLPDRAELFRATQDNLARAERVQGRYAYKERRTELHTNPFGRLGTGAVHLYDVTPTPEPGFVLRTLLETDGVKVANPRPERQERRERGQTRTSIDDVASTLEFTMQRRERVNGRDAIVVTFAPKPDGRPQTREGKLAKMFTGTIWVDEAAREVMRVEATAMDSVSYGLGLIARLNKGTRITLTRERVDDDVWLPTSVRFVGEGKAVLFRRLNLDFAADWFDYRKP